MVSSGSGGSGFTIQYVGTPNRSYAATRAAQAANCAPWA